MMMLADLKYFFYQFTKHFPEFGLLPGEAQCMAAAVWIKAFFIKGFLQIWFFMSTINKITPVYIALKLLHLGLIQYDSLH